MARSAAMPALKAESGLSHYLEEIRRFPMLEPQEEYMLARSWREHGDTQAAHKLVTSHLRLVAKIAMGYRGYGLPISEVVSEGNVGLMQAVKRFEPEKGFRLATYAMWWIKAAIQEYILRSWSLVKMGTTANQKKLFFNLRKAKSKISALDEGDLRPDQVKIIAKRLGVNEQDVVDMNRRLGGDASLNAPIRDDGESGEWMDWLVSDAPTQEKILADSEESDNRHKALIGALDVLNEREKRIFEARRLADDPVTLEDLASEFGVSRERVRQIEVRAFEKVQKAVKNRIAAMEHPEAAQRRRCTKPTAHPLRNGRACPGHFCFRARKLARRRLILYWCPADLASRRNKTMALLFVPSFSGAEGWRDAFAAAMPELDVRMWPELGDARDIDIVALGQPPAGLFRKLPNLRLIVSVIAGTDALLRDPDLPDVPIVRAGDPAGDAMMNEAALLHVLRHHRHMPDYLRAQQRSEWIKLPITPASERKVGVMGLGAIGLAAANTLTAAGFQVAGWVRTPRRRRQHRRLRRPRQARRFPRAQRDCRQPVAADAGDARHYLRRNAASAAGRRLDHQSRPRRARGRSRSHRGARQRPPCARRRSMSFRSSRCPATARCGATPRSP